jgi:hypothetical protein
MRRLALPLLGLWVALMAVACVLQLRNGDVVEALITPALGVLACVGALLCRRRPENRIGTILLGIALVVTLSIVGDSITAPHEGDPAPPTAVKVIVAVDEALVFVWFGLVGILLPLLFPDGKLPSPRWRMALWVGLGLVALAALGTLLGVADAEWGDGGRVENPLALGGPAGDVLEAASELGGPAFALAVLAALASVVVRFRRADGVERQQLKWFVFTIALLLLGLAAAAISEAIGWEPLGNVGWAVFLGSLIFGMPLAIAFAVLRYRLYDLDLVIRRTLVYGSLTVTLAAAYLGTVLLVGLAVGESGFAVAVSTLAVAALFRPLRARIQAVVDRRFYRRRYDAARTLEAFGGRLRDEIDLEALGADLARVVHDTVQPAHVSLWLRSER